MSFQLHNFFRSSTSTRLRAVLNLKGLDYDYIPYVLRKGETRSPEYLALNPQGLVPSLVREDGTVMTQSLAIIEWLDEVHPEPALLPADPDARAQDRALAYLIACDIHPLNNLRVLQYLGSEFGADEEKQKTWFTHWVSITLDAFEQTLASAEQQARYCLSDTPGLADVCLYAQIWNNKRFGIPVENWPNISRVFAALDTLPAFQNAAPPKQPDAA
ncbi:maleylacetoacetate isomerase [Phaeobacter gallaeciensis]|uniref:Maleylacetoacetate isomerase n=1 Tax=Phaeobacter gallaeciensis TaxID=60890 RepID=A0AAC9ZEL4_9RHOB|nr:maleylacetoacetate isomerase [Phaeobacter gallaeciensis]AHD11863.1 maleylacetoacetate isomerase [Phaeobacter gallaeciensis DSM 26640]ATE95126.1 maleylacetoacetate isomerase [Phaeobacter gallaeciensis]ATE99434.1 maleylacetoacetate isomerase [Phaeobacter gallaeciensis]ATF03831.1 maleylacetoacetate isomerase [Phaeobacter gallaeciensis]ATF08024.1 maleylacetoacetate isomerase [Phaeobacter gallaeciensis]